MNTIRTKRVWNNGEGFPINTEYIFHVGKRRIGSIFEPSPLRINHPECFRLNIPDGCFGINSFHPTYEAAYNALMKNMEAE